MVADLLVPLVGPGSLVLGLPRGGVPVAAVVARRLGAELDVVVVRKVGVPGHEELALGAVASGGLRVLNADVVASTGLPLADVDDLCVAAAVGVAERERAYRDGRPAPVLAGRTVVVADDGLATGASMRVAARAVRSAGPERLLLAVPVGPRSTCGALQAEVDEVVCALTPDPFRSVGAWYEDFAEVDDDEVRRHLSS